MDSPVDYAGPAACGGPFARLTLNSPHNRNALSSTLVSQLHQGLSAAEADPAVRLVVLGHTGGTFCAGADLSEAGGGGGDPYRMAVARAREMTALLRAIVESPLPVVGAINGHVRAGGFGLVGACDMVVAGPESTFALTEARIGVAPAIISLTLLPKLSPRAAARYYLTGEKFGAREAADIGRPPWYKPIWALRLNPVATDTVAARSGAFTTILRSASYAATPTAPVTTVGTAFARNPCYTIADAPFVCRCPEKHRSPALVTCCWHPASAPRWPTRRPRHRRAARVDRSAPA